MKLLCRIFGHWFGFEMRCHWCGEHNLVIYDWFSSLIVCTDPAMIEKARSIANDDSELKLEFHDLYEIL